MLTLGASWRAPLGYPRLEVGTMVSHTLLIAVTAIAACFRPRPSRGLLPWRCMQQSLTRRSRAASLGRPDRIDECARRGLRPGIQLSNAGRRLRIRRLRSTGRARSRTLTPDGEWVCGGGGGGLHRVRPARHLDLRIDYATGARSTYSGDRYVRAPASITAISLRVDLSRGESARTRGAATESRCRYRSRSIPTMPSRDP